MSKLFAVFLAVAALQPFAPRAARADMLADEVRRMPAEIEETKLFGAWAASGRQGAYRVVIARAGGAEVKARVFVQWIEYADTGAQIFASTEITELTGLGADVKSYAVDSDPDRLVLTFELATAEPDKDGTWEAIVRGPDNYQFQKAGN